MNGPLQKPLIVAHRGASALAPENTLAAFEKAIDDGAEGIEFDVRLTRDKRAVVFHDTTLERTAGIGRRVIELNADQLEKVDVGSWFNRAFPERGDVKFASERIATLEKALDHLSGYRGEIYIELKCRGPETEPLARAVCEALEDAAVAERVIVKSFELNVLEHMSRHSPTIRTAALFAPKLRNVLLKERLVINTASRLGADELSLHYALATRGLMDKARKHDLPVTVWTVDHPRWLKRALKQGLKAVITNNPARMLAYRREMILSPVDPGLAQK